MIFFTLDHVFIVEEDGDYVSGRVECSDPSSCGGWIECTQSHTDLPFIDEAVETGDTYLSHGEEHWVENNCYWAVNPHRCMVEEFFNQWGHVWPEGVSMKEGQYPVEQDWYAEGEVGLFSKENGSGTSNLS